MWLQRELRDGTYDFKDLLDAHEMLDVKEQNESIAFEWVKRRQGR